MDKPPSDEFMRSLLMEVFFVGKDGVYSDKGDGPRKISQTQAELDVKNLRFYADMFQEHHWQTAWIHWSVFAQTLREIAARLEDRERPAPYDWAGQDEL